MSLQQEFDDAVIKANSLPTQTADIMLKCYAYYKQATVGDIDKMKPEDSNIVDYFKYNTWERLRGTGKEEAMKMYIKLINELATENGK